MKTIIQSFGKKLLAVAVSVAALGMSVSTSGAAPAAIRSAGIREYHHRFEIRVVAPNLDILRYRVAERMNFGWIPVGGAYFDGFAWVQIMVRE